MAPGGTCHFPMGRVRMGTIELRPGRQDVLLALLAARDRADFGEADLPPTSARWLAAAAAWSPSPCAAGLRTGPASSTCSPLTRRTHVFEMPLSRE